MPATISTMPRPKKPPTITVRLDKDVARQLRIVAAAHDEDVPDYLANVLRPILSKELRKLGRTFTEEKGGAE